MVAARRAPERVLGGVNLYPTYRDTPSDIHEHLEFMRDLCVELDAQVVVELGVRFGVSTAAFLDAMEATGGMLWSCDIARPFVADEIADHDHWMFVWGNDLELVDEAPECDVLFIDTSHHYQHTVAELEGYAPKTAKAILLHDTQLAHPAGAPAWPEYPVRRAALEYVTAHREWDWTEFENNNGLGVMTRRLNG